jgi:hypothetical protein
MPAASRHDLIFAHEGNARVAASVIMAGMLAVLLGGTVMAIGPELKQEPRAARNAGTAPLAAVRVIGTAPREQAGCDQQVWPNIDQRCLVRTEAKTADAQPTEAKTAPAATPAPSRGKIAASPAQDDGKLSPLTVTPVEHQAALKGDATSGNGVQEDTAVLRSSDTVGVAPREDATVGAANDELDELPPPPPPEKRRSRGHRHTGFHLRIGAFHF